MRIRFALLPLAAFALVHCSSSSSSSTDAGTTSDASTTTQDGSSTPTDAAVTPDATVPPAAKCRSLPAGAQLDSGSMACTTKPGLFTTYTVNVTKNTYFQGCDVPEADLYADQADFDKNEGTSTAPDVKVKSKGDYVRTNTCASGSTLYTAPGEAEVELLYLWEKTP